MEKEINYSGASIHYKVLGKGNTVVLLHGFTESLSIWENLSDVLSFNNRVILIDLPGHGKSECIADIHTMEEMALCVKAILEAQKVNECIMIGHSMGGYVTLAFADLFPRIVQGIGLIHSSALADTPEAKKNRQRAIDAINANHNSFVAAFIPDLFAPENRKRLQNEIKILVDSANNMSGKSLVASQKGMMERKERVNVFKKCNVPFLFILGKQDPRVPFCKVLEQASIPNYSEVIIMGDVGHMGFLEQTEKTVNAIQSFVERVFAQY